MQTGMDGIHYLHLILNCLCHFLIKILGITIVPRRIEHIMRFCEWYTIIIHLILKEIINKLKSRFLLFHKIPNLLRIISHNAELHGVRLSYHQLS